MWCTVLRRIPGNDEISRGGTAASSFSTSNLSKHCEHLTQHDKFIASSKHWLGDKNVSRQPWVSETDSSYASVFFSRCLSLLSNRHSTEK